MPILFSQSQDDGRLDEAKEAFTVTNSMGMAPHKYQAKSVAGGAMVVDLGKNQTTNKKEYKAGV